MQKRTEQGKANKYNYDKDYHKKMIKMLPLNLNINTDADILEHLSAIGNKASYIKELIRNDMKKAQ